MRRLAVINQKGGCGKTTVAINLSSALARMGRRVLLVDLDPQAHATVGLGVRRDDLEWTTYEVLVDPTVELEQVVVPAAQKLDLVPASTALSSAEQELAGREGREDRLAEKIERLPEGAYDFVIVDCPPSVGLLTFNALVAAREVLIPIDASYFSLHGLAKLRETIEVIEEELGHRLAVRVLGNNMETRTHFSKEVLDELEKFHGAVLLDTFISHTVRLKEAAARGVSVFDLDRSCKAALQFQALARELLEKEPRIHTEDLEGWMERLQGPKRLPEGVLFTLDAPEAKKVAVTGEFTNWSREGITMERDPEDGLWKVIVPIEPGEYEYRFIVDGLWIRDPANQDYVRNEFGQENSLLIV
jgi:chromosome partitioning protein